ncbi:MAG: CoA transferase [Myxococcota bacterium]|jgi:crotonobetainyl-CoA:carnitine CoA-transferase CaiB-like acyl-CoA transferase|nr:CoA transferase [Myxococcota bacterium]
MEAHQPDAWPLAGWRVVDLSSGIAGPYCSKLLADAGADVIKVESPDGGDPLRNWTASGTAVPTGEDGVLFQFLHASKRSIALDPARAEDREKILGLAARADLLIEDHGPGGLAERGLGIEELQAVNPRLSILSISPWGLEGPHAERPATEFTLQAATGSIDYRGLPGRKPVAAGGRIGEWAAGSFAAPAALSAVFSARKTGLGHHVDLSIFESMLTCLTIYHDLSSQWFEGPLPRGIEIPSIEPASDGYVGYCVITGQQWTDFCAMLGRQDIAEDHQYLDGRARMEHIDFMQEMIQGWTSQRSVEELIELAGLLRIPVAEIGNGQSLPEMEQVKARKILREGPGGFLQPRPPYQLGAAPLRPPAPSPRLDEHAEAILGELAAAPPPQPEADPSADPLPLAGLRVVDLTAFWAGPVAASYLADMGADVVKVESVQRPDGMRFAGAVPNDEIWEWSPVFHGANPGKRGITLALDTEEGMQILRRMLAEADIVIENYSARVLENFGLGWNDVSQINPRIIMVRMPAFGLEGPWRDRAGFAMTVEQVSGLAWLTGYSDLPLVIRGACDPIGGMHAVYALQLALEHRRRTGKGQLVEVPLMEVAINLAAEQVMEFSHYGQLLIRDENRGPVSAPQGVYRTAEADELIALAIPDDARWRTLREIMGDPEWSQNPELDSREGRRAQHDAIDEALEAWLTTQPREKILTALQKAGIPAETLINAHSLSPNPQLEDRGFFQVMEHPRSGEARYPSLPMAFSGLPRALHRRPPPTLGQHNDEVLGRELGLTSEELARLREEGIIGERPSFM